MGEWDAGKACGANNAHTQKNPKQMNLCIQQNSWVLGGNIEEFLYLVKKIYIRFFISAILQNKCIGFIPRLTWISPTVFQSSGKKYIYYKICICINAKNTGFYGHLLQLLKWALGVQNPPMLLNCKIHFFNPTKISLCITG